MKIAFFGTGNFSKNILEGILKYKNIDVALVVSQPDKPIGRKKEIFPTPIKILAHEKNIPVLQPIKLKDNKDFFQQLSLAQLDFIVVVAYGKIVPTEVLTAPKYGCINIHGSILPAYRGASPIQEAIKNGDSQTGITIMYMSEGMDEGDILQIETISIAPADTTEDIFKKFENIGPNLLINTLEGILSGQIKGQKQNDKNATYCKKIEKLDGQIDFQNESGQDIFNKFKAYTPWPGIFTYFNGKKLNIEDCHFIKNGCNSGKKGEVIQVEKNQIGVVCDDGFLQLKQIKLEGKKSMDINSFVNGNINFINYNF